MDGAFDILIIGGGAAGLAASIFAARKSQGRCSIAIAEKQQRVGRKLLATGNGTCNLSNIGAVIQRYHGEDSRFAKPALELFDAKKACEFFKSIGVECIVRQDGRIYPLCAHAGAVLDCMRLEAKSLAVIELCETTVNQIIPKRKGFIIKTTQGVYGAENVIVSTGGAASPTLGGTTDGYKLLTTLGHTCTPLFPSIVQVRTDTSFIKAVKGIRVDALVSFEHNGKLSASEKGEVLFTEYGLSGPAVMQISRFVSDWEGRKQGKMTAVLNLLPDMNSQDLSESLRRRASMAGRTMGDFLTGLVQKRLGQTVLRWAGYRDFSMDVSKLNQDDLKRIATAITRWETEITGTQGMRGAQVTAGGIATGEFNPHTMESLIVPRLYAVGEMLDIDGDCGGFNLQWAWSSAYTAASAIFNS